MQKPRVSQSGKKEQIQHGVIWGLEPPPPLLALVVMKREGKKKRGRGSGLNEEERDLFLD